MSVTRDTLRRGATEDALLVGAEMASSFRRRRLEAMVNGVLSDQEAGHNQFGNNDDLEDGIRHRRWKR